MVHFLQSKKIKVFTAVSERKVKELSEGDISCKEVEFCFQGFREYDDRRMRPNQMKNCIRLYIRKSLTERKKKKPFLLHSWDLEDIRIPLILMKKGIE